MNEWSCCSQVVLSQQEWTSEGSLFLFMGRRSSFCCTRASLLMHIFMGITLSIGEQRFPRNLTTPVAQCKDSERSSSRLGHHAELQVSSSPDIHDPRQSKCTVAPFLRSTSLLVFQPIQKGSLRAANGMIRFGRTEQYQDFRKDHIR